MMAYWDVGVAAGTPDRFLTVRFMSTTLHSPDQWAQLEFGLASLGDRRRTQRLVTIATHLAVSPGAACCREPSRIGPELKAAYRFFGQRGVKL